MRQLDNMNKPAFDPTKPFEVASNTSINKPPFDPNKPYQEDNGSPASSPPQLDLDLRRMTGSFNPNPPMIIPSEVGNIPQTFGSDAGNMLAQQTAEDIGEAGYPKTGATFGTAIATIPPMFQTAMLPDVPIPSFLSKGAGKFGKMLAGGLEKATGIPAENTANLFKKPMSLFTAPTQKEVSTAYSASEFPPDAVKSLEELIDKGTGGTARYVKRGSTELENYVQNGTANSKTILEARQALDKQIALLQNQKNIARRGTSKPIQNSIDDKVNLRKAFNSALDKLSPKLREADALASERFKISPFRDFSLPGKLNSFSPEGIARAVPGLPIVIGGAVSGSGAAADVASEVIKKSPKLINTSHVLKQRILDEKTANDLLDETNGDVEKARQLATERGYKIPANAQ
jgi:hypothetical protein